MMDMTTDTPPVARVTTLILQLLTVVILAICLTRRVQRIRSWRTVPVAGWLVIAIYIDSLLFVVSTTVLEKSYVMNASDAVCSGAILLCLSFYVAAKFLIFLFFVEKVYVIRNPWQPRLKDKIYLFNMSIVVGPYITLAVLGFVYRFSNINNSGNCIIGIKQKVLIPMTLYEVMCNILLTTLFLAPLRKLHSFNNGPINHKLRKVAQRTLIGSICSMTSTAINFAILAGLNGEKHWVCMMNCNLDILVAVVAVHWATTFDSDEAQRSGQTERSFKSPDMSRSASSQAPSTDEDFDRIYLNHFQVKEIPGVVEIMSARQSRQNRALAEQKEAERKTVRQLLGNPMERPSSPPRRHSHM